jgi:methionyl-tRNA synthetase
MAEFINQPNQTVPIIYDSTDYGALANNVPDHGEEKFYLTTAISYTNGYPHIGHAYEFLSADALVRYNRVLGKNCFFLTGTDEHGQKVAASAEKGGKTPLDHCDHYVGAFKELHKSLLVTYSDFLRTRINFPTIMAKVCGCG